MLSRVRLRGIITLCSANVHRIIRMQSEMMVQYAAHETRAAV